MTEFSTDNGAGSPDGGSEQQASWVVAGDDAGGRLDSWLARRLSVGRARVQALIADGHVRVAGRHARKSQLLVAGDVVELACPISGKEPAAIPTPDVPLDVRHETSALFVVNKPPGQPTHPMQVGELGTLANALLGHYPELEGIGYRAQEPGVLHRLDNGTSGLVVVARHAIAFDALRRSLQSGHWTKHYQALVSGRPSLGTIRGFASKDRHHRARVCVSELKPPGTSRGVSLDILEVEPVAAEFSLVTVSVSVAVRHQIRAQLAAVGHPIVGDTLYRGHDGGDLGPSPLTHHVLHACRIVLPDPAVPGTIDVRCELPESVAALLVNLRGQACGTEP